MIPKYKQIMQALLQELKNHIFIPGDKFYSEADIKQRYSVSSITAIKVLNELTSLGYLYRIRGKGTFVSKSKVSQNIKFSDIKLRTLASEKVIVLSVEEDNDPKILKELGLPANISYYKVKRVHYSEGTPFLVHVTHLPKKLIKEPISKNLNIYSSIYDRVHKDFSIDLFSLSSVETNEVVFPDDPKLLNLLHLSFREPAIKQVKHSYLTDGSVAEYIISYKHWKYFKIKIEVDPE
ncbi:GntR family transcriptional regulator [Enterococcus sp. DIV0086]|uniref:GntR family transcriptional regulator n=1 Tax=Enterococcus sp. DIV0086 TaxID=2774655 RepID=UPI003D270326